MEEILVDIDTSELHQSFSVSDMDINPNSNSLRRGVSNLGFHFQPEGSVINFYCEL